MIVEDQAFGQSALTRPLHAHRYWFAKALALLLMPIVLCVLYCGYRAALSRNVLAVDIGIFVIVGQASMPLMLRVPMPVSACSSLLLIQLLAFSLFTFMPPFLPIFRDQRNGLYGIEAGQIGKRAQPLGPIDQRNASDPSSN